MTDFLSMFTDLEPGKRDGSTDRTLAGRSLADNNRIPRVDPNLRPGWSRT
jgi:hypothetical protein